MMRTACAIVVNMSGRISARCWFIGIGVRTKGMMRAAAFFRAWGQISAEDVMQSECCWSWEPDGLDPRLAQRPCDLVLLPDPGSSWNQDFEITPALAGPPGGFPPLAGRGSFFLNRLGGISILRIMPRRAEICDSASARLRGPRSARRLPRYGIPSR